MNSVNLYDGEIEIALYDKIYPMKINLGVIAKFQSETGKCFNNIAVKSIQAWNKTKDDKIGINRAASLTDVISMTDAATLFYIAAKEMDSQVTFEEIQEAVLMDGAMPRLDTNEDVEVSLTRSYPILFVDLSMFALVGIFDKKKVVKK